MESTLRQISKSAYAVIGPQGATNFAIVKASDGSAVLIDADIRRIIDRFPLRDGRTRRPARQAGNRENFLGQQPSRRNSPLGFHRAALQELKMVRGKR